MIFTYASPVDSPHTKSKSRNILENIESKYDSLNTIVMGDLNGRTKLENDFVSDKNDEHSPINDINDYTKDQPQHRKNMDSHHVDE